LVQRLATHALGRRVRRQQFGVRGFKRLQFPEQPVVLGIRNAGVVQHVVAMGMLVQNPVQFIALFVRLSWRSPASQSGPFELIRFKTSASLGEPPPLAP
jgi:hypothetical protein